MEGERTEVLSLRYRLIYGAMFILPGVFVFAYSYLMGKSYEAILRNTISSMIISGTVVFMLKDAFSRGKEALSYDNYDQKMRFVVVYFAGLLLSIVFPHIPNQLWPYMALFVILSLFSNAEIGLVCGTGFVIISVMLEESGSFSELFLYVLAGAVAIAMFRDLKENTAIGMPLAISMMMQAVLLVAFNVLFQNRTLSFNLLILPVLNLMLNVMILLIFLNMFGVYVIRKTNDMYMEINDPEFKLLAELKDSNKDDYYQAIHTAYLSERIAHALGLNSRAIKACAYYHGIGEIQNKTKWEEIEPIYTENSFPLEAIEYLHEYIEPAKNSARSKEMLTVQICESLISTMMGLIKNNKDAKINYDELIDQIFDKKAQSRELTKYDVTYREYDTMRKILKREKLYYDFLR